MLVLEPAQILFCLASHLRVLDSWKYSKIYWKFTPDTAAIIWVLIRSNQCVLLNLFRLPRKQTLNKEEHHIFKMPMCVWPKLLSNIE